jgi:hypothetical protein
LVQGLRQSKGKHAQNREIKTRAGRVRGWFWCRACGKIRGNKGVRPKTAKLATGEGGGVGLWCRARASDGVVSTAI